VRDGSFLASKIISELGVVGVLLIGFIVYNLVVVLRKMLNYEFDIIVAGSICLIAILLFERGLAYFAAPVIYCLISIIHSQKVLK
jgi:hypothetical protein